MHDLESTDTAIITALQRDGRLTNSDLATRINLSPSATLRRVRRLEETGVITGYHATIAPSALGLATTVFVEVRLESQREDVLYAFEEAAGGVREIVGCHLISGDADYLLRVQTDGVSGFEQVHTRHLSRLPGVVHIRSYFAMRSVFDRANRYANAPSR
ncbi:MAG: Lrp/AsnC family transcriptional regulator [Actinobacteria bacterium]|nr:Lrp/AsnC family transcriptional regulator [Actinomycetota bacterium]